DPGRRHGVLVPRRPRRLLPHRAALPPLRGLARRPRRGRRRGRLLNLVIIGVGAAGGGRLPVGGVAVGLLLVPVLSVALTAASVGLYDLSGRVGLRWLFTPPGAPARQPALTTG